VPNLNLLDSTAQGIAIVEYFSKNINDESYWRASFIAKIEMQDTLRYLGTHEHLGGQRL